MKNVILSIVSFFVFISDALAQPAPAILSISYKINAVSEEKILQSNFWLKITIVKVDTIVDTTKKKLTRSLLIFNKKYLMYYWGVAKLEELKGKIFIAPSYYDPFDYLIYASKFFYFKDQARKFKNLADSLKKARMKK